MARCIGLLALVLWVAGAARADIVIERLDGPATQAEVESFLEYMKTLPMPTSNRGNGMVYGQAGGAVEALGDVYQISPRRELLDLLVQFADHMLAARNDPQTGRILWTGKRDLAWPNKTEEAPDAGYSGTENGDVIAHIGYAAELILRDKSLWDQAPGANDKFGYGKTYLERARTYVRECDRSIDTFLMKWIDPQTHAQRFPTSELYGKLGERYERGRGKPVPWNQQGMISGGFQRLAICHEILGDDPARVVKYDAIVRKSVESFLADVIPYEVNGAVCYKWSYVEEGRTLRHVEDTAHGGYDVLLMCRAWSSGRYGLTRQQIEPLANTALHVLNRGGGQFAWRIDGTGAARDYLPGTYLYLVEFKPALYDIVAPANLKRASRPETGARLLWAKHYRHLGQFPSHSASKEKK